MTFYERFTQLRKEKGVTQLDIHHALGVNKNSFANWKKGTMPLQSTQVLLANYFGVTVDYLLGKTDERTVPDKKLEGLDFALSGEIKTLTENEKQDLLDYIRFKKQQKEERDK